MLEGATRHLSFDRLRVMHEVGAAEFRFKAGMTKRGRLPIVCAQKIAAVTEHSCNQRQW